MTEVIERDYELVATQKIGKYTISVRLPSINTKLIKPIKEVVSGQETQPEINLVLSDDEQARRCMQCSSLKSRAGVFRCERQRCKVC